MKVVDATEQNMKLHDELDSYHAVVTKMSKDNNKLRLDKEELMIKNTVLI